MWAQRSTNKVVPSVNKITYKELTEYLRNYLVLALNLHLQKKNFIFFFHSEVVKHWDKCPEICGMPILGHFQNSRPWATWPNAAVGSDFMWSVGTLKLGPCSLDQISSRNPIQSKLLYDLITNFSRISASLWVCFGS